MFYTKYVTFPVFRSPLFSLPYVLQSVLRLQKRMRKDPSFRVVLSGGSDVEPPSLEMFKLRTDLTTDFTPTKASTQNI